MMEVAQHTTGHRRRDEIEPGLLLVFENTKERSWSCIYLIKKILRSGGWLEQFILFGLNILLSAHAILEE